MSDIFFLLIDSDPWKSGMQYFPALPRMVVWSNNHSPTMDAFTPHCTIISLQQLFDFVCEGNLIRL
jgi:hypothetical protein